MKKVTVKEIKEKVERLIELEKRGFNIPRFCYVIHEAPKEVIHKSLDWAKEVNKQDPEQIFNIRTYSYNESSKDESMSTPHITDIEFKNLKKVLLEMNEEFSCMIDAETPDDGRIAGNVTIVEKKGFISKSLKFYVDYCKKEKRAMVRDADISGLHFHGETRGPIVEKERLKDDELERVLVKVVNKAIKFNKVRKNSILEWTYFCKPAGIKLEPIVWWEYRKYE